MIILYSEFNERKISQQRCWHSTQRLRNDVNVNVTDLSAR